MILDIQIFLKSIFQNNKTSPILKPAIDQDYKLVYDLYFANDRSRHKIVLQILILRYFYKIWQNILILKNIISNYTIDYHALLL